MAGKQSKSVARLNEDLKRLLTDIISKMKDPRLANGMVSVTRVETGTDLAQAKVFVSLLDPKADPKPVLEALRAAKGHVRSEVAARMTHLRRSPELVFIEDDSAAYAAHINELLKDLN